MPFQTIKDPETGEERRVYVAPKPAAQPAAKPQAQPKPQAGPSFLGGASPAQVLYDVVGSTPLGTFAQPSRAIGEGIVRGAQELVKTGDIVKAAQAGVAKAQQAPAALPQRAMQSALRNTLQELSDVGTDIAGAAFGGGGTTAKQPDKPFLGVLPALPKQPVKLGMLEEVTTGLLQLGVQMSGLGLAQTGLTATALASKTPAIAKAGQALQKAEKGVQALQKAPVLGGGIGQATKGLAQRGLGYYVEGAGKGAIVDFAGFDQHAENISSMVDSAVDSLAGTDLQLPVVEYLRSKPGDEGAAARLRNAVDGFAWGGPAGMALGAGAAGIKGTSKLLTKTLEFVKAAKDEADLIKTAQRAATQPAAAVVEEPARAEVVEAADMQARMQDAEQQVRRAQTQLEQLGPEPERPEVKEKGPRATAYRSWTRKANALQKQLTEAQSVLSSLTMESGITRAPEFNRVTGRTDLRIPEERPAQAPQVVTPAPSLEEVAAKREVAQQELKQAWEEARTQMDQPEVEVLPPAAAAPAAQLERPLVKAGIGLSHGTTEAGKKGILTEGFRVSQYEKSGTVAGEGVYMTPSGRYAKEYGQKTVEGALPEDAKILDWTGSDQTLASLADEIGIPGPRDVNKSAGEVELNQAQQQQLKQWALDNGYDGIQYRTNFTPGGKATEVVLYNTDLANRMVGSKAAPAVAGKAELPDTRGKGEFFHGTAQEIKQLEEGYYESKNVYGQGFYTTDDLKTANAYTKKNRKAVAKEGGAPEQVVYRIQETTPVNFYDLDAPVSPSIKQYLETAADRFESVARALDEVDADPQISLAKVMDEIRANSRAAEESRDTIQEVFDGIRETLQAEGYGGFTHQGGKLAGRGQRLHQVKIYWDPANQINVERYQPGAPAALVEAPAAATPERIAQIDEALAMGRADLSPEERIALRDQLLAQEAGGGAGAPPPTEPPVAQMGPLPDPDLEAVVNAAAAKLEDLKAGRITLEDLMRNEVRRFVSPSGQTIYNSRASEELMAFVQSISDNVIDPLTKAKVTGQPSLDMNDLHRQAARQMRADGFTPETIDQMVGRAQEYVDVNSDVAAKVRFVRSMQLAIDHLGNETAIIALRWKNRNVADVGERGDLAKQLIAAYDELSRVYVPYMALGRQAAQEMRGRQMKNAFDGGLLAVPQGTVLRHGTDSAAAQAILEGGFKQGSKGGNLLGAGVYFTTSKTHAAAYGNTEIYGDIPADTLILDLIEGGRSINDVAKEIGLGPIKTTLVDGEPIQYMTNQQKDAFRAWVLDQGYDGVRYDATFSATGVKGRTGADEVVIYDVNKANRVVGSKAAVQPPEPPKANAVEVVAKEMQADVENLLEKLDPKAQEEIKSGLLSDQTEQLLDTLADGIQAQKSHGKYAAGNFADKLRKAPPNSLTMDAVTQFYISSLLWSDATWYGMLLGGIYKAATKPLVTATGFYAESLGKLAKQDMRMAVRNYRRGNKQWQLYADYQLRLGAAWKLIKMSFELGAPINTTMRGMSDYGDPRNLADADAAARLAGDAAEGTMALRENTVDNPFFLDPEADYLSGETFNPLAAAVRAVWKANNLSTRIAAAIDTGLSHIVVPAVEYRRFFVEELERAEDMGLGYGTKESTDFAVRRAQERLDAISRDVYLNGQTIKNGVLVGTAAENVTNWLNFTDDVWVSEKEMREQRTYEGGLREANNRGIADPEEANAFAVDWAQQTPNIPGWSRVPSMLPWLWEKAVNQAPVLRLAQAFNRSPANILKSIMRGTPFAPLVDSYQRDIQSEIPEIRAQANGELVVGSTIAGLLFGMATSGLVQFAGSGPENPDQNRKWRVFHNLTTGPISMRVKNVATGEWHEWVSMQRLDQIGAIAGFIGDFIEIGNSLPIEEVNKLGGALTVAGALVMRAGKGQFDRTSYQGFKEMIESLQGLMMPLDMEGDRINPAVALVENIAAKLLIPLGGGVRTSRRVIDERRVSVPASDAGVVLGFLQEVFDKTRAQIPGMSSDLPGPLHPVTGAPLMASGIWGTQFIPNNMPWLKALYANITPTSAFPVAPSTNDPVDNELSRLQGKGSTFNFFPPTAVRGYRMTYEEHQEFTRIGTSLTLPGTDVRFHEALRRLISSDEYLSLASTRPSRNQESDQVVRINDEYEKYKQEALIKFLESPMGAKAAETLQRLEQSRIDQRMRLAGGALPSTMPAEGTQAPGVQSWSITPGNR